MLKKLYIDFNELVNFTKKTISKGKIKEWYNRGLKTCTLFKINKEKK